MPQWRALPELHWQQRLERLTELSLAYHEARAGDQRRVAGAGAAGAVVPRR
ncbi:MAG: hypothetical protein ACLQDY_25470 [Streptosporangiaceae bacterium]